MEPKLDNPAWWALNSYHEIFAQGSEGVKRYRRGIVPFIACRSVKEDLSQIDPWIENGEFFYIIGELPVLPAGWTMEHELPCTQMLGPEFPPEDNDRKEEIISITSLGETDKEEMFQLINSVQPGYYEMNTRLLGTYYGIKHGSKLLAMAGERMRPSEFAEISAVCTHPAHTGQGYARRLITHICQLHRAAGIIPFLHTALTNKRAIRLYEHMGFTHRRTISFWRIRKG